MVEHNLAKVGVASSILVSRSILFLFKVSLVSYQPLTNYGVHDLCETFCFARVVELVDTRDLKSLDHCDRAGSSPASGTISAT